MEREYLEAAIPERFRLLGQELKPFALGHLMLLRRLGNAFSLPQPLTFGDELVNDLILGVFVCCQTYEEATAALQDPRLAKTLKKWSRRLGTFDAIAKSKEFARYIAQGSTWPDLHDGEKEASREPGAPYIQRVRIVLQAKIGLSPSEALNYPWGLAQHDYFAYWELEEKIRILNDEERSLANDETGLLAAFDAFAQSPDFAAWLDQARGRASVEDEV